MEVLFNNKPASPHKMILIVVYRFMKTFCELFHKYFDGNWINKIFPAIMIFIMIATLVKYGLIQDFKRRSSDHLFLVETENIKSVEKALRDATFQEIIKEKIAEDKYKITVRCPPEKVGSIRILINNMSKMFVNNTK